MLKKFSRRRVVALAACALPAVSRRAAALDYPSRPVRIVVGFAAGGANDLSARIMAQWLSDRLGPAFVVENRPGAGTNIAAESVVHAAPDGYTLLWLGTAAAVNATLYPSLPFSIMRDIAPVGSVDRVPNVMAVHPAVPAATVPEFIAYAKANPGKLAMGSAGNGSLPHVAGVLFMMMTGVEMVHTPYRGEAPALIDLLGGHVQVVIGSVTASAPYITSGKVRALAVTGTGRSEVLPDVPLLAEFVPGYEATAWFGVGAPKNTPAEIVEKLNAEINLGLADAKVKERFAALGCSVFPGTPATFGDFLASETKKWGAVVRAANIQPD
jgi:tripartite-type tricarboxylate transporter receptor subunit TctC